MQTTRILAVVAILAGCATAPPTEAELEAADYGSRPSNHKQLIHSYLQGSLRNPDSAEIRFANKPVRGWRRWRGKIETGYAVCVNVNAKNSFDTYTGFKDYYFLILDDRIVQPVLHSGTELSFINGQAQDGCNRVAPSLPASAR